MHSFSFARESVAASACPGSVYPSHGILFFDRADSAPVIVEVSSLSKVYQTKQRGVTVLDRFPERGIDDRIKCSPAANRAGIFGRGCTPYLSGPRLLSLGSFEPYAVAADRSAAESDRFEERGTAGGADT